MASKRRALRGGIDLGGTKIEAVIVDGRNQVLGSERRPTPVTGGPPDVAEAMSEAVRLACASADVQVDALAGVGVGSPGIVEGGTISNALNLPGWRDVSFDLGKALRVSLGTPVRIGNDVQVATDGEFQLGAGKPYDSLLGVFWGTGVGGGLILGGKPWLGRGGAAEIGHMVVKVDGARCPCGRKGCMEAYAGRAAMEARARRLAARGRHTDLFKLMEKRGRTRLTSGIWARALEHEDKLAKELIDRAIHALGAGIASAVNLLDVEAVVIGGGLGVRFGQPYVDRIAEAMQPHLFNDSRPPAMHVAALGDLGGAIGASLLVQGTGKDRRERSQARARAGARARGRAPARAQATS